MGRLPDRHSRAGRESRLLRATLAPPSPVLKARLSFMAQLWKTRAPGFLYCTTLRANLPTLKGGVQNEKEPRLGGCSFACTYRASYDGRSTRLFRSPVQR